MKELNINNKIDNTETFEINPNERIDTTKFSYSKSFEDLDPNKRISEHNSKIELAFILEKQQEILELNSKLKAHLEEKKVLEQENINGAFLYGPHNPEAYWDPNNLRIGFCNLETYSIDKKNKNCITTLDTDTLDGWTDKAENKNRANTTITNTYLLNFCIRYALESKKELTVNDISRIKKEISVGGENYDYNYAQMDKSEYFNFRYTVPTDSPRIDKHKDYIEGQYKSDSYYGKHYKEFCKITDPKIIIIGGSFGVERLIDIYPELKGDLKYCGQPVMNNGRMIVSIKHPGWISDAEIADTVNKITKNIDKLEDTKKTDSLFSEINRGPEMSFTEADSGHVNPNLDECDGFQCNCQTCVVVFEARLRGYDIEARPMAEGSNAMQLSEKTNLAWLTADGTHPDYIMNFEANSVDAMYDFIDKTVKPGERYTLEGTWKGWFGVGHIISVFRENTGNLVFYDPQINQIYSKRVMKEELLPNMQKGNTEDTAIKLLRIDNLAINTEFVEPIVRRSENHA